MPRSRTVKFLPSKAAPVMAAVATKPIPATAPRSMPPARLTVSGKVSRHAKAIAMMSAETAETAMPCVELPSSSWVFPIPAIHILPKTGPYQRNPSPMWATVATMTANQLMVSAANMRPSQSRMTSTVRPHHDNIVQIFYRRGLDVNETATRLALLPAFNDGHALQSNRLRGRGDLAGRAAGHRHSRDLLQHVAALNLSS